MVYFYNRIISDELFILNVALRMQISNGRRTLQNQNKGRVSTASAGKTSEVRVFERHSSNYEGCAVRTPSTGERRGLAPAHEVAPCFVWTINEDAVQARRRSVHRRFTRCPTDGRERTADRQLGPSMHCSAWVCIRRS